MSTRKRPTTFPFNTNVHFVKQTRYDRKRTFPSSFSRISPKRVKIPKMFLHEKFSLVNFQHFLPLRYFPISYSLKVTRKNTIYILVFYDFLPNGWKYRKIDCKWKCTAGKDLQLFYLKWTSILQDVRVTIENRSFSRISSGWVKIWKILFLRNCSLGNFPRFLSLCL